MIVLLCAYHAHSKTVTCDSMDFIDYIVLSCACTFMTFAHHMHQCCSCLNTAYLVHFHDCVICLSQYQCVLISWTNLDLIKFMFVSCGFALGSLLCVCTFVDVSPFLSRKRACD